MNKVEVIIFRKTKNRIEYLLLKRTPARGGFWQPVTGNVEPGESVESAARREVKEETGITNVTLIKDIHQFMFAQYVEHVFGAEVISSAKVILDNNHIEEHTEYRWCTYDKAMHLLRWQENMNALKKLHDYIGI